MGGDRWSQIAMSEKWAEHRLAYRSAQNLQIEFVCPCLGAIMHNLSLKYGYLRPYTMPSCTRMACTSFGSQQRQHLYSLTYVVFTARRYASAVLAVIVCLSVCPSVRLSVTSRSCTQKAKPRIRLTTPYDSPETLVFRCQKY